MDFLATLCLIPLFIVFNHFVKLVLRKMDQCCYMLAYECYKPDDAQQLNTLKCAKVVYRNKNLDLEDYRFLLRTMVNSGLGEETFGPKNVVEGREGSPNQVDALAEMDDIIFDTLDKLFVRTGISPSEIDILVTTVSLFAPAPSLSARVINRYKMKDNIKAFSLSGMGCSASVVAIDLVHKLFKSYNNSLAIVVSTEAMGQNWYCGKDRSMMLSNVLFRTGGCSFLLTNNRALKNRAILKLTSIECTHLSSDEAYNCCMQQEDELGYRGFHLSRYLPKAGAEALSLNLRRLLPKVLPLREILRYTLKSYYRNKVLKGNKSTKPEVAGIPDINLKSGIDHFCVHPGGKAVIEGVGKVLGLSDYDLEPARMALHRFGNTSSGGLWYVLGYMEAKKRLKKGEKILMISLGAGFKCNNCVWEVMRDMGDANAWKECVDSYPPSTLVNPFLEKFDWINDDASPNFARVEEILQLN